jgi:AraC-like DNA-binding protein
VRVAGSLSAAQKRCEMRYESPEIIPQSGLARVMRSFLPEAGTRTAPTDRRANKLRRFLDTKEGQVGWSLDTLCRTLGLGISAAYAGRLFKREFGIGVREYAAGRRLLKAAHLLRTTHLGIKTISGNLGYRSPADFTRRFRQEFGRTPSEYRNLGWQASK